MNNHRRLVTVGIGEVLWDVFPDQSHFGGAPGNFAAHCASLDCEAWIVSRVGTDDLGHQAQQRLAENGVQARYLQIDPDHPTGTVTIELSEDGKATYEFADDTAWDHLQWQSELVDLAQRCDSVCFGTLGQRNPIARQTIRQFVEATGDQCLRVLDVNLRQQFYDSEIVRHSLQMANAFKLNDEELPQVLRLCGMVVPDAIDDLRSEATGDAVRQLLHRFQLKWVTVTGGEAGALYLDARQMHFQPAPVTKVVDTVGAGDSFTATLVADLLGGFDPVTALDHAVQVAGYVCTQPGATPAIPESLRRPGSDGVRHGE